MTFVENMALFVWFFCARSDVHPTLFGVYNMNTLGYKLLAGVQTMS